MVDDEKKEMSHGERMVSETLTNLRNVACHGLVRAVRVSIRPLE